MDNAFSRTAINSLNALFYSSYQNAFVTGEGPTPFFVSIEPIQQALFKKLGQLNPADNIRIKEICSGARLNRWQIISNYIPPQNRYEVTLTDFSDNSLPDDNQINNLRSENLLIKKEKYNLFDRFPELSDSSKVDIILTTYGFDGVWLDWDKHLEKKDGRWFETKYRLKVFEDFAHKEQLTESLKKGYATYAIQLSDFDHISIEKAPEEIEGKNLPFREIILNRYGNLDQIKINFPGGLIKRVTEAFLYQLKDNGIFFIGDAAANSPDGTSLYGNASTLYMEDYEVSGKVAKFKVLDFGLAKDVLDHLGFATELKNLKEIIAETGVDYDLQYYNQWILIVRNKNTLPLFDISGQISA